MKKQTLKISLLSFILLALGVMVFFNNSKAANVDLSLTITAGGVPSCSNATSVTLNSLTASFSAQSQTGTFTAGSWTCTDTRGTARGNPFTVVGPANLTAGANQIPGVNVKMSTTIATTAGNLTGTTAIAALTAINSTQSIYSKTTANTIGTFTATPTVVINVPANQTPGTYTGTITVTYPS